MLSIRLARPRCSTVLVRRGLSTSSVRSIAQLRHDPLRVSIPTDELGLPVPQSPPITAFELTPISHALLQRLHGLAALNPPPEGSPEETALRHDLGDLVGLMDLVHEVEVRDVGELLSSTGEIVFNADAIKGRGEADLDEWEGRPLLDYATRRVGDFYGFKATIKGEDEG
ncbi:uncharacterized protein CcaverHIS019_0302670 [Cutaneotrichosporon cavernicola]|uniref:Uncharacterized protein n=1 Tax=Cutaneotrichosporon cavernicola TaxID=279322 RepID=A0AA48ICA5_9TREE|nr:uncharacterized protein CcaverHIS019_0302670 [Cutaneotrichosporon cavernicola]BEI90197.1 hypothetical protein CcaverHIS019_0302670 [Cutaneotrichosporon cavernicola]BEI97976.1 hypothetical protein CcaverHIS631_0302750 [Cutaneotrichosporon cavernicola]BEJ05752.1 hypothetical protein CcaverHIS641_0302740 [Cutaneotrichosporon cavernicola]